MVNLLRPGDNLNLPLPDAGASTNLNAASLSLKDFVTHLVPKSVVEAMANNEILQIVVFSLFFGVAAAALGERAAGGRQDHRRALARHPDDHRLHHGAWRRSRCSRPWPRP